MPSLRSTGKIIGNSVSIKQLAQPYKLRYPLSLRALLDAWGTPPYADSGVRRRKVIPLAVIQQKLNEFVNDRERPMFKFRAHGEEYGKSELTMFFEDPVSGELKPYGSPTDLRPDGGKLEVPIPLLNPDFMFNDLNTALVRINIGSDPVGAAPEIAIRVEFETGGEEIKINNTPNVNLTRLILKINLPLMLDGNTGLIGLTGFVGLVDQALREVTVKPTGFDTIKLQVSFRGKVFEKSGKKTDNNYLYRQLKNAMLKEFILTDAKARIAGTDSGILADKLESVFNDKLITALLDKFRDDEDGNPGIDRRLTRLLVGGDYPVVGAWCNGQMLNIEYIGASQIPPFPESPQAPLDPGLLANIDHIVVLMMENRSFDHMLGYLSKTGDATGKIRTDVEGLGTKEVNVYKNQRYESVTLSGTQFVQSPCHDYDCVLNQVNGGKMDGFVADFVARYEGKVESEGSVMGYYQAQQVPVFDALAREFMLCDHWFCSHPGPTFPNRFYQLTGRLNRDDNGRHQRDNPSLSAGFAPVTSKTIFDHLSAQNVSWRYYEHGYCFLRLFERYTFDEQNIVDVHAPGNGFFAAAQAGNLPSVSFIDPDFIDLPPGNDDHPPTDIVHGQRLISEVVNALKSGPSWNKTLLVISYDEHAGFFDHVQPPPAPDVSGVDRYGPRVPTFVISPWVARGSVSKTVFDHTSILKTIARRFLAQRPPDMGERMNNANDLSSVLSPSLRNDNPAIPMPPAPVSNTLTGLAAAAEDGDQDFHGHLRYKRFQFFQDTPAPGASAGSGGGQGGSGGGGSTGGGTGGDGSPTQQK